MINPIIFVRAQDDFLLIFVTTALWKNAPKAVIHTKRQRHLSAFIGFIFHHWCEKSSLYLNFSIPKPSLIKICKIASRVVDVKTLFNLWSPFSFNSEMSICYFEANTLRDWWPTPFQSICHPHSLRRLWWTHLWLCLKICYGVVYLFKTLVYNLHNFCVEVVLCLGFLFQSYFFVNTSSWSNIQCPSSPFKVYWRWWLPQSFHMWEDCDLNPWDQKSANPPYTMVRILQNSSTYFSFG